MKYLFTAYYNDETCLKQTAEDVSIQDPTRSAFFDVDHDKLIAFEIANEQISAFVDLRTGEFNINGVFFSIYDGEIKDRRLIYFRRHLHHFNQDADQVAHEISFYIGWQGNDPATGENVQRTIRIA